MSDYALVAGTPAVDDYRRLRQVAGLSEKTQAASEAGLPNTWFAVTVRHKGQVVGMGRVIADGDARHLYAKFGFQPVMPESIGMALWLAPPK